MDKELRCMICGAKIIYKFGRPRKVCDNPLCQKTLQKIRVRRFKLKKKRVKGEATQATLKLASLNNYEPTIYNTELGNMLNSGEKGSIKVVPDYKGVIFYREPMELTIEFAKDSIKFYKDHPDLVNHPEKLKPNPKPHRIGAGAAGFTCEVCGSSRIALKSDGDWICLDCGSDFSLPIYWSLILK
jgi:hypothetical protein